MSDYLNAMCKLMRPHAEAAAVAGQREHRFDTLSEKRCSLRKLSAVRSIGPLGRVSLNAWTLRLKSGETIKPGWRVLVKADGEDTWAEYVVEAASRTLHWQLTLEGVG